MITEENLSALALRRNICFKCSPGSSRIRTAVNQGFHIGDIARFLVLLLFSI